MSILSAYTNFEYAVTDINGTIKQTNSMLRALNAVRVIGHDVQEFINHPSLATGFWIAVQISRAYNSLKRLNRLIQAESNVGLGLIRGLGQIPVIDAPDRDIPAIFGQMDLSVNITAFRDNLPMGLEGLDISGLPERSRERLQRVFEDDAEMTVMDARQILRERILHPEDSTGNLEHSIGWRPQVNGTQIYADAFYAWWVENGQRSFLGHHFLKDATERARVRLPLRIKAELDELIKEETGK